MHKEAQAMVAAAARNSDCPDGSDVGALLAPLCKGARDC
jgi:hypothetical protein